VHACRRVWVRRYHWYSRTARYRLRVSGGLACRYLPVVATDHARAAPAPDESAPSITGVW